MARFDAKTNTVYDMERSYDPSKVTGLLISGHPCQIKRGSFHEWSVTDEHGTKIELFRAIDEFGHETIMGISSRIDAMWIREEEVESTHGQTEPGVQRSI